LYDWAIQWFCTASRDLRDSAVFGARDWRDAARPTYRAVLLLWEWSSANLQIGSIPVGKMWQQVQSFRTRKTCERGDSLHGDAVVAWARVASLQGP
jgi:hypothetical protein